MGNSISFVHFHSHERSELTSPFNYRFNSRLNQTTMKKLFMVLAATVICGACLFTSCKKDEDNNLKLEEKIIGKWMTMESKGKPAPTNRKSVVTFVSATKAYISKSFDSRMESSDVWMTNEEADVVIDGNKVTLTSREDEHITRVHEYTITSINANEFSANVKLTKLVDGNVVLTREGSTRLEKVNVDYRQAILGTWQGHCTSAGSVFDDGQEHRWEYRADGSYVYYRHDGQAWVPYGDDFAEYFVDGNLLCTRWRNTGEETENREWWEISINGNRMNWTALRQNDDGSTFTATFEMEKVSQ